MTHAEVVEDTDLWAELRECLEVLTEHADRLLAAREADIVAYRREWSTKTGREWSGYVPPELFTVNDETITAIHQAVELVLAMGEENDMAWASIQPLRVVINDLQQQLADRSLWTPPSLS